MEKSKFDSLVFLKMLKEKPFREILETEPPKEWIMTLPEKRQNRINGEWVYVEYLPIDKVELLLRELFDYHSISIKSQGTMFGSVFVTISIEACTPDVCYKCEGLAAEDARTGSVKMALPAAKSEAIKNAAKSIGKIFGRDLNRDLDFDHIAEDNQSKTETHAEYRMKILASECTSIRDLNRLEKTAPDQLKYIISKRRSELSQL